MEYYEIGLGIISTVVGWFLNSFVISKIEGEDTFKNRMKTKKTKEKSKKF